MYLRSPRLRKKANIGSINTVPPILKIAKACTLFCANELTNNARNGVKSVNEFVQIIGVNQSNISQHLNIMNDKGILKTEKKEIMCSTVLQILKSQRLLA